MFDLNEKKFGGAVIFNNGQGGLVKNVEISVEKKQPADQDNHPDYKVIVTDSDGGKINQGFYYPKADNNKTAEQNEQRAVREVSRVLHIARAVLGANYEFPQAENAKQAFDVLFTLISDNIANKRFNVFVNYGTEGYASKYMGLRYFNFIEPANTEPSRLRAQPQDLLQRIEPDAPKTGLDSDLNAPLKTNPTQESWI